MMILLSTFLRALLGYKQTYQGGQKLLERQRYQFPTNWLYVDNIDGEWGAYNEIMKRKDGAIQQQVRRIHKLWSLLSCVQYGFAIDLH